METAAPRIVVPPAVEPVTVAELRAHARIDYPVEDLLLATYGQAARQWIETWLGRALITQTLEWTAAPRRHLSIPGMLLPLFSFPMAVGQPLALQHPVELPRGPVQAIETVTLTDINNISQALDPAGYVADTLIEPGRLILNTIDLASFELQYFTVRFTAGYGDAPTDVPTPIRLAVMMLTAFLYEHRGDTAGDMPAAVDALLSPYRLWFFA